MLGALIPRPYDVVYRHRGIFIFSSIYKANFRYNNNPTLPKGTVKWGQEL
jgi:hypothetical protein